MNGASNMSTKSFTHIARCKLVISNTELIGITLGSFLQSLVFVTKLIPLLDDSGQTCLRLTKLSVQ